MQSGVAFSTIMFSDFSDYSEVEALITQANKAEVDQHWAMAAILWRRASDFEASKFCESILVYLATHNLERLPPTRLA